jgi:hypothetical protein
MEKCIQEQRSPTGEGLEMGSSIPLSDKLYGMKLPMGRLKNRNAGTNKNLKH